MIKDLSRNEIVFVSGGSLSADVFNGMENVRGMLIDAISVASAASAILSLKVSPNVRPTEMITLYGGTTVSKRVIILSWAIIAGIGSMVLGGCTRSWHVSNAR